MHKKNPDNFLLFFFFFAKQTAVCGSIASIATIVKSNGFDWTGPVMLPCGLIDIKDKKTFNDWHCVQTKYKEFPVTD